MTDEERQKLCDALRNKSDNWLPERLRTDVQDIAAEEIERLAAENRKLRDDVEWAHHIDGVRRRKNYT
jgi:Mg2+ and Co2+ transporter CorA